MALDGALVRRLAVFSVVAGLGGLAGAASLQTMSVEGGAGPGVVRLTARADLEPRTQLLVPPFGRISAQTHAAPVTFSARVEQIDLAKVQDLATGRRAEQQLRSDIESDLSSLARQLLLRCMLVAVLAGAVVGAVVPRRRRATVLTGAMGGLVVTSVLLWSAWSTFDERAFDEPRFSGPVSEAPRLLATARMYVEDFDAVRGRIAVLSAQVRDLYATTLTEELAAGPGGRRILHVSDLHLNPVGVEVIRELAEQFDVDAVLDTGDITSFGHPLEGHFGQLLGDLDLPYYLVPGNHDSMANREVLAGIEGVTVVDGDLVEIAGVRVLGVGHPAFTADNQLSDEDIDSAVDRQSRRTARLVASTNPDVLAVHDPSQADDALGDVPLVIAGHTHSRSWTEVDGTLVLTVGTTGASGLGAFTVDTSLAYEAAVLYFEGDRIVAVDNIALRGTDGEFRIDRRLASASDLEGN